MKAKIIGVVMGAGLLLSCVSGGRTAPSGDGWVDLLADGLAKWTRAAVPPGSKLSERNPWSYAAGRRVVVCEAQPGILEALRYGKEFADGIFHVEWRFRKEDRDGYNSGIYFRCAPDFTLWHQAQVAIKKEPPVVGDLFGNTPVDGTPTRVDKLSQVPSRAKPIGEWNTYEITCRGGTFTLWVNGAVTATWTGVKYPKGYFALQAEHYYIEFRNVRFKSL